MAQISIRDLQMLSAKTIGALPGPTTVKSGGRTVALLVPLKAADPDRLAAVLTSAEALAKGRDPAADYAALAPFGEVDPVDWSVEAVRALTRNRVDYLPIDQIDGRIATTLFVVYPPCIATIVPGERLGARAKPMLDYLKVFEQSANLFPGFEAEIQGLYREIEPDGSIRFYTYVMQE